MLVYHLPDGPEVNAWPMAYVAVSCVPSWRFSPPRGCRASRPDVPYLVVFHVFLVGKLPSDGKTEILAFANIWATYMDIHIHIYIWIRTSGSLHRHLSSSSTELLLPAGNLYAWSIMIRRNYPSVLSNVATWGMDGNGLFANGGLVRSKTHRTIAGWFSQPHFIAPNSILYVLIAYYLGCLHPA